MKNSANNSVKVQAQSMAVATVKGLVCIPHIILQTSADLLSLGEAHAVNLIDGTPVIATVMARQSYTQEKMAKAVGFALQQQEKLQAKLDRYRQQDIDKAKANVEKLNAKIDKLEGVEHITEVSPIKNVVPVSDILTPGPISAVIPEVTVPAPPVAKKVILTPKTVVPAPPVNAIADLATTVGKAIAEQKEEVYIPINKRGPKAKATPLMTVPAAV